jgi:hypothetical protein
MEGWRSTSVMNDDLLIQWLGDISLNGPYCDPQHASALRANLQSVADGLGRCDLRIANWEAPLWGDGGVNERKVPRLATLPQAARAIESLRLDVALLANNHVYDCLEAGFENTVAMLREMGVVTLGAGRSQKEAAEPLILIRRGCRLGLLNYVGHETHPNVPPGAGVYLNWFDEERAVVEIGSLSANTDAVLVHLHWGADEFIPMPAPEQRRSARRLVDAGARIVVAGHAHVLQGHEAWNGGYIFHGIGNFLFWPPSPLLDYRGSWPRYVREVGVAGCRLADGTVREVSVRHLVQDGLALRWDETPRRRRRERVLCGSLRLPEASFVRARRIEALRTRDLRFKLQAIRQAGGLWPWAVERARRIVWARRLRRTSS